MERRVFSHAWACRCGLIAAPFVVTILLCRCLSSVSQELVPAETRLALDIFTESQQQWAKDLPPELFQEMTGSGDEESVSALATIPELIQKSLARDEIILMNGN